MANIHSLNDGSKSGNKPFSLGGGDSDDEENSRYVGGTDGRGGGSGLAVLPTGDEAPKNAFDEIRSAAEATSGEDMTQEELASSHTITMYRDGFTIDEGEYRRVDDPLNEKFLKDLASGYVPSELQKGKTPGAVGIKLIDRRGEEYVPPAYTAFSGGGNSMVAESAGSEVDEGKRTSASVESAPKMVDGEPLVSIQVVLPNRQKKVAKVNKSTAVEGLVGIIRHTMGVSSEFYVMGGYPQARIENWDQTVAEADLVGAQCFVKEC